MDSTKTSTPNPTKGRSLRKDQRGTAIAETVIMMPAFLFLWAAVLFGFQLAHQTMRRGRDLREQTWAYHYAACEGTEPTGMANAPSGGATGGLSGVLGYITGALLPARHTVTDEFERRGTVRFGDGRSFRVRHRLTWNCNTRPQATSLIGRVWDLLTG